MEIAMTATAFTLIVLIAGAPPYLIGTFPDFQRCAEAGVGQVESLQAIEGHAVTWQCLPDDRR
jgi:hypothetical protein